MEYPKMKKLALEIVLASFSTKSFSDNLVSQVNHAIFNKSEDTTLSIETVEGMRFYREHLFRIADVYGIK